MELALDTTLGGLGGGTRSGGADLVAFLFSGLSVTNGASVSSFASEEGTRCLFAGTGAVADEPSTAGLSFRGAGVVGFTSADVFS